MKNSFGIDITSQEENSTEENLNDTTEDSDGILSDSCEPNVDPNSYRPNTLSTQPEIIPETPPSQIELEKSLIIQTRNPLAQQNKPGKIEHFRKCYF